MEAQRNTRAQQHAAITCSCSACHALYLTSCSCRCDVQAVSDHHKQENEELRQRVEQLGRAREQVGWLAVVVALQPAAMLAWSGAAMQ